MNCEAETPDAVGEPTPDETPWSRGHDVDEVAGADAGGEAGTDGNDIPGEGTLDGGGGENGCDGCPGNDIVSDGDIGKPLLPPGLMPPGSPLSGPGGGTAGAMTGDEGAATGGTRGTVVAVEPPPDGALERSGPLLCA